MNFANDILDAIEIMVKQVVEDNATKIYTGVCKTIDANNCVLTINGKDNAVKYYGGIPVVGTVYQVFIPFGNMSAAFIIVPGSGGGSGGSGVDSVNGMTGEVVLSADDVGALSSSTTIVNPNLLDNWYFANPVNQRGQTEYTAAGYTIDRWKLAAIGGVVRKTDGGIFFGCIKGTYAYINNDFETSQRNSLNGKACTISVLTVDGNLCTASGVWGVDSLFANLGGENLIYNNPGDSGVNLRVDSTGVTLAAAKLELGSQQTLAHQDANGNWVLNEIPDYGEQLRRCQRYFVNFNPNKVNWFAMPPAVASSNTDAYSAVTLPVVMRAQPTVSYGGKIALSQTGDVQVTGIQVSGNTFTGNYLQLRYSAADGLTANSTYRVQGYNDPTSYIWLSADL